jgi:hypothetical protein
MRHQSPLWFQRLKRAIVADDVGPTSAPMVVAKDQGIQNSHGCCRRSSLATAASTAAASSKIVLTPVREGV